MPFVLQSLQLERSGSRNAPAAPQGPFSPAALPGLVIWLQPEADGVLVGDPTGSYSGPLDDASAIGAALGASEALLTEWSGSAGTIAFTGLAEDVDTAPANTAPPQISGTARVDSILSVSTGTWTGTPAPSFTYQWHRTPLTGASENISGATSTTYLLVSADLDMLISCTVTATNVAGSAAATSEALGPVGAAQALILDGIPGAVAEWDSERSVSIGNPVQEWRDLIGSNHAITDLNTSGPDRSSFNNAEAMSFASDHMRCGSIVMPQPTGGGATLSVVVVPGTISTGQVAIGEGCSTNTVGGASIFFQASGVIRAYLGNGTSRQNTGPTPTTFWATGVPIVAQMTYDVSSLKLKINNGTPVTVSHSFATIEHRNLGLGAVGAGSASSALTGLMLWAGYCTGAKSNTDLSTIATRLMARFFP